MGAANARLGRPQKFRTSTSVAIELINDRRDATWIEEVSYLKAKGSPPLKGRKIELSTLHEKRNKAALPLVV